MTFKDIKTNNTVFILDKNNLKVIPAKVINDYQPKIYIYICLNLTAVCQVLL